MTPHIVIALDGMGGDQAPELVVLGADIAYERMPDIIFKLVGNEEELLPLVRSSKYLNENNCDIIHTLQKVGDSEKPSVALRSGRKSSMRLAIDLVSDGDAHGVVSAGNTGALMAMSKLGLRMCPGIERPAIASFFPTLTGESCMLDLGANIECDSNNLVQFAVMGQIFARIVLGLDRPSVGLLNVGSEEQKGHEELREAAGVLKQIDLPMEFVGFVEGDDITAGTVDVIVTDGFSGNIALKAAEGTSRMFTHFMKEAFRSSIYSKMGYLLSRGAITQLRERMDPRKYNGAVFLGLNGIAVKSHGGTDAVGFANAVGVTADMARFGFLDKVKDELSILHKNNDLTDYQEEV
ncbi:MAG: phosphate acyltransferase [Rhodospirillaceae bacterium]|nr:phosphate acyltransferase [Rhodospirillaceae bacterium]|tara:strand:- start:152 stop:1204 length:1053 start_codon:yes stop_codon:yes gene_type:complete